MIVRIWRTGVEPERVTEYEQFAATKSLPMFRQQMGFRGVFFTRSEQDFAVITLWEDQAAVDALKTSPTYEATVGQIVAAGFLTGAQSVEVFEVQDFYLPHG